MNIKDLMQRYKITRPAVLHCIKKNISIINSNGEHAKQTSEGWQFDAEAVRIIDELRGISQISILEESESEIVKDLRNEIDELKKILMITQSKLIQAQENLTENQKLLFETKKKLLVAENQSKDSQVELKLEQALHNVTKQQLEKIKNRNLIDRIFNNY